MKKRKTCKRKRRKQKDKMTTKVNNIKYVQRNKRIKMCARRKFWHIVWEEKIYNFFFGGGRGGMCFLE
jgi:hypothetical protein